MGTVAIGKEEDVQVKGNGMKEHSMGNEHDLSKSEKSEQDGNHSSTWVKLFEEVAEKSGEVIKTSASKVGDFTTHATHLAKLKLEAHKLNNELCELILEAGHKLWKLHKDQKLDHLENIFSEDFKEIAALERKLRENQNQLQN